MATIDDVYALLTTVAAEVSQIKGDVATIKIDVSQIKGDVATIDTKLSQLNTADIQAVIDTIVMKLQRIK